MVLLVGPPRRPAYRNATRYAELTGVLAAQGKAVGTCDGTTNKDVGDTCKMECDAGYKQTSADRTGTCTLAGDGASSSWAFTGGGSNIVCAQVGCGDIEIDSTVVAQGETVIKGCTCKAGYTGTITAANWCSPRWCHHSPNSSPAGIEIRESSAIRTRAQWADYAAGGQE